MSDPQAGGKSNPSRRRGRRGGGSEPARDSENQRLGEVRDPGNASESLSGRAVASKQPAPKRAPASERESRGELVELPPVQASLPQSTTVTASELEANAQAKEKPKGNARASNSKPVTWSPTRDARILRAADREARRIECGSLLTQLRQFLKELFSAKPSKPKTRKKRNAGGGQARRRKRRESPKSEQTRKRSRRRSSKSGQERKKDPAKQGEQARKNEQTSKPESSQAKGEGGKRRRRRRRSSNRKSSDKPDKPKN